MKLSYLISCHNESRTLHNLLIRLFQHYDPLKKDCDEIVILDDYSDDPKTQAILNVAIATGARLFKHALNVDYGSHKNWGTKQCNGDYIFQIDGDELPSENILGENLKSIIEVNPNVDLIFVPRINDYRGVTEEHAKQWGWRLNEMEFFRPSENKRVKAPIVNFCDYQGRIFKNDPERIKWDRKLHEKIVGHTQYSFLPAEEEYAIYHDKTIEKQLETNIKYNKIFSVEDNMGHKVI